MTTGSDRELVWANPSGVDTGTRQWRERRWEHLKRYDLDLRPCVLGPPEAFSDELAPLDPGLWYWPKIDPRRMRENSRAVEFRLGLSFAGSREQPSARDFYEAVHAREPSERQQAMVYAFVLQATEMDLIRAWTEQAYSWRVLVRALHKAGFDVQQQIRIINEFAEVGEYGGVTLWER